MIDDAVEEFRIVMAQGLAGCGVRSEFSVSAERLARCLDDTSLGCFDFVRAFEDAFDAPRSSERVRARSLL